MMRFRSVASPVRPRLVAVGLLGEVLEVSIAALDFGLCGGSHVSELSFA
jgi:hypothetical protein